MVDSAAPWRRATVPLSGTIESVVRSLNETGLQIALVVSDDMALVGTVTDGDIRRGLLRGLDLTSPIDSIVFMEPLVVTPEFSREMVLHLMQANRVRQLPIVDERRQVVGLHTWDALLMPGRRENLMVIMAGGKGTRLRPHTEFCPKPLLPVGGKPMLEHIIERARDSGFTRFVLAIHYLGHMIEDAFGNGERLGVSIDYLREDTPLGTAGALSMLVPRPTAPFLVSNGDVLTDIRYDELLEFHLRHGAAGTMAVRLHEWAHPFGVVRTDGVDITGFEEKPVSRSHINAGIYALEPSALDELIAGEPCDMPTLFTRLRDQRGRTIVYPMHEPWLDVGRDDDLTRARSQASDAP
jgi:dTDP-glucose pyrophosphorylase